MSETRSRSGADARVTTWRASGVALALLVVLPCGAVRGSAQDYGTVRRQLEDWIALVEAHQPGAPDDAILAIGRWSGVRLDRTTRLVHELAGYVDVDTLVLRGAMLHLDAVLAGVAHPAGPIPRGLVRPGLSSVDSRGEGRMTTSVHLAVARALLDEITPRARDNGLAHLWYRATTASLAQAYKLADLKEHLEKAAWVFGEDAVTRFDRGCLYEAFTSRRVRALMASTGATGVSFDVPTERASLVEAARSFRAALDLDPHMEDARIRLGRVLVLAGRRDDGVAQLTAGLGDVSRPDWRYDAYLFLGRAAEDDGRDTDARAFFEAAQAIFPRAQSAALALARLEGQDGKSAAEHDQAVRVLNMAWDETGREDPWWTYHQGIGRDADRLIDELRRRVSELPR